MEKRRTFIKKMARLVAGVALLLSPFVTQVRVLYAQAKRTLVPKGTKMQSLLKSSKSR